MRFSKWVNGTIVIGAVITFVSIFPPILLAKEKNEKGSKLSFMEPNEEVSEVINDSVIVSWKKETIGNAVRHQGKSIYFLDKNGKVSKKIDAFPQGATPISMGARHSGKYIVVQRNYQQNKKNYFEQTIFDNNGKIIWKVPENKMGTIFPNDSDDSLLIVNGKLGYFEKYSMTGEETKAKTYFSDQNENSISGITVRDLDSPVVESQLKISDGGSLLCVSRIPDVTDVPSFLAELTLISLNGEVLFQKKDRNFFFDPLLVSENLKIVLAKSRTQVRFNGGKKIKKSISNKYSCFDFSGNLLWELNGDDYHLSLKNLNGKYLKVGRVEKNGTNVEAVSGNQEINLLTGQLVINK